MHGVFQSLLPFYYGVEATFHESRAAEGTSNRSCCYSSTVTIAANFARFGNAAANSELPSNADKT